MALTLQRTSQTIITYDNVSKGGIDNVVTALSTEYTQNGFRYIVNISVTDFYGIAITTNLYVHPNPYGRGIINLRPHLINALYYRGIVDELLNFPYIHNTKADSPSASLISFANNMNTQVAIEVYEGWEVAGVFTQDPDAIGPQQINLMAFWGWDNAFSFNQNNSASSPGPGFNDLTSSTYYQRLASKVPPSFRSGVTFVPTLPYNLGTFCINADDGTFSSEQDINNKYIELKFYTSSGLLLITDTTSFVFKPEPGGVALVPAFAGNITYLRTGGIPANTAFYTVQIKDFVTNAICSTKWLFVIEDIDCDHNPIPLGWIGKKGGWNYYNFIKTNQNSIDIERTEYKKPFGNYGRLGDGLETPGMLTTDWSDNRQYVSRENMITKYLTVTSDWITEEEFVYLESLMVSEVVHIVNYDGRGDYIPMIVTDNSYIMRRERNSTKYNLTLKLKYAQDYQAINYNTSYE
jgi:hypothetical protein